ncbi:MAG TPA: efflux RND transporter periplasmic adaptor subunit [Zeimonas sp.]
MPKTKTARLLFVLLVALAVVAGAVAWRTSSGNGEAALEAGRGRADDAAQVAATGPVPGTSRPALTVTVTTPRTESWPIEVVANGSIAAWQEIVVGSEVSGVRLAEVRVNVGDRVKRGQLLARLADETVQAERAQTRAALAEAEATLAEANANAERARKLEKTGAISAQQIAQYLTAAQTARARVQAQRARLQADEVRLGNTRIVAPDDGVISSRTATMGSIVQPGAELFRLIRGGRLEWRAEVPAADLARVRSGQRAHVQAAEGTAIEGRVRVVAPTVDPQTRMGIVYVDLPVPSPARAGVFARGDIELGSAPALTVAQSAVALREGFAYVFRIGDDSKVVQTKVALGRRIGDRVEIVDGLEPDARIIETGAGFLADGDLVRVVADAAR